MGLALLMVLLGACSGRAVLRDVKIEPSVISPNADGVDDVTVINYKISESVLFSMYFVDAEGTRHYFREDVRRVPSKNNYVAFFGGSIDGSLLPDGTYTCVLEAKTDDGQVVTETAEIVLKDGDKQPIEIRNLVVAPNVFTPNRDGIKDRVTIGYYLTKEAARIEVYITDGAGNRYPVPEDEIRDIGAAGNHEHDYDAGVDQGATPPPDGVYTVWVVAEDFVGNQDVQKATLTIEMGGVPQVEIIKRAAQWSDTVLALGDTLTFTCTVKNIGRVPVRTKGPEPGTTYTTSENFNTHLPGPDAMDDDFYEEPGIFRIGVDFEGNTSGRPYPYRWQLGDSDELTVMDGEKYLMPEQSVEVTGSIHIIDEPTKISPYYWLGLLHEQVRWVEENVERTQISIGF